MPHKNLLLPVVCFLFVLISLPHTLSAQAGGENQATATLISSLPFIGQGNNSMAVDDYAENCPDVGNGGGGRDHVYRYNNGPNPVTVDVSLCVAMTDYDSQLYIYEDSCASGTSVACMEDGCQSPAYNQNYNSSIPGFTLQANKTYYFVVDGFNSSGGNYQINIDTVAPPPAPTIQFTNSNNQLTTTNLQSGVPMAVVDMNNDWLDDIVRLDNRREMYINFQQPGGGFSETFYGQIGTGSHWSLCAADFDENGMNDLLMGGSFNGIHMRQENGLGYSSFTLPNDALFLQGSNFADINNDGHIDIFACSDLSDNKQWEGDGTGNFVFNNSLINTETFPVSDNSGNYASIWTDYDNDGDLDMYLSKCRQGVSNPGDPRRINMLFRNNGLHQFEEVSFGANLKDSAQTWLADFGDIDNDGDLDAIIINHDFDSRLMQNNGDGTFTDISMAAGIANAVDFIGIQAFFRDFNNDGFIDLFVTGNSHKMFVNNGNGTFTEDGNGLAQGTDFIESCAIGDLNHDGFLDIYGGYATIYNNPSSIDDVLWLNNGTPGNNFFVVNPVGTVSNINGIGARVEIYGSWGMQIREVRSGEGYGVMNSYAQHFGLGTSNAVDSVIVRWPSGIVDLVVNPNANSWETIIEGQSPQDLVLVYADSTVDITNTSADLWGNVRIQDSSETQVSIKYWRQAGGPIDSVFIGTYSFSNNIAKFNFDHLPNSLWSGTTYEWMVDAIYDVNNVFGPSQHVYSDTLTFTTSGPTVSIQPGLEDGVQLSLYPNPFHTEAYLEVEGYDFGLEGPLSLEIYEIRGKLVRRVTQIQTDRTTLERGQMENGVYLYRLNRPDGSTLGSGRLILN